MAGVKSLLKAAANDMEQTAKAQTVPTDTAPVKITPAETAVDTSYKKEPPNKTASKTVTPKQKPKNLGGRPTNKEQGLPSRKQYTLTLKEDTYQFILQKAREEDRSFAKFMERAALEYIDNHF